MSVQFRTAQTDLITVANTTESYSIGVCCQYNFNVGAVKSLKTPLECYLLNGTFFYETDINLVNCLDIASSSSPFSSTLGCCCACSIAKEHPNYNTFVSGMLPVDPHCNTQTVPDAALNMFGLKKITQCECERIGGKWTAGDCPESFSNSSQVRNYCYERMSIYPAPPDPYDIDDPVDDSDGGAAPCGSGSPFDGGAGGEGVFEKYYNLAELGFGAGTIGITYNMFVKKDSLNVYYPAPINEATYQDAVIAASTDGCVSGKGSLSFFYNPSLPNDCSYSCSYEQFLVRVVGCEDNTQWNYTISCPVPSGVNNSLVDAFQLFNTGFSCDVDLRLPRSCCYFDYDINGFPVGLSCENVCNPRECQLKSISSHPSVFSEGTVCSPQIFSTQISGSTPYQCGNVASLVASGSRLFENIRYGSCFNLIDNGVNLGYSYECDVTSNFFCSEGYWIPIENDAELCFNHPHAPQIPQKSKRKIEPETMLESDFDSLKLRIGERYKGGIYIGKYIPGSPINPEGSVLFGSREFSYPTNIKTYSNGKGDKYSKWAIIVDPAIYNFSLIDSTEKDTTEYSMLSNYDGFYNCYGSVGNFAGLKNKTINTIVGKNRKGFVDWYIPSIDELMFLSHKMLTEYYLATILLKDSIFMSSSSYNNFIYVQYFGQNPIIIDQENMLSTNYGRLYLSKATSTLYSRLFRKIVLT